MGNFTTPQQQEDLVRVNCKYKHCHLFAMTQSKEQLVMATKPYISKMMQCQNNRSSQVKLLLGF